MSRDLTFVFENRSTVWFQLQEMVRAERIVEPSKIAEKVKVYNALLPKRGELAATLMIEIDQASEIKPVLDRMLAIDTRDYVRMIVGPQVIIGDFEAGHSDEERVNLSAVHFVRFTLPPAAVRRHGGRAGRRAPERAGADRALGCDQAESSGRSRVRGAALTVLIFTGVLGGCSDAGLSPAAERGRQTYVAQCIACHNTDPTQAGALGPPLKGSSRELLEAKVLNGTYPPGYTPKRSTKVMVPLPAVAPEIAALAEYLGQ